ncbi:MAG: hypothetical protein M3O36_14700 [Myxococcota bacterium]|nr:hypothetical protein [Myxococcota bacterium]
MPTVSAIVADGASSPALAASPALPSPPPGAGQATAAGHAQLPFVHTQLVATPPSTVVPSHAGLAVGSVYAHSRNSPVQDAPGVIESDEGQVPTSLQAPAVAETMAAATMSMRRIIGLLLADVTE